MNSKSTSHKFCELSVELLDQSMVKIRHCLEQLSGDQVWWRPQPSINSVGNLCLHLDGNLRQWGIVPFSEADDERDRESEFSSEAKIPAADLLLQLEKTVDESKQIWEGLSEEKLQQPVNIQGFDVTFMHAISHTSSHFVGHAHQIIMLTRIKLGDGYRFQWSPENGRDKLPI